ncbi:MAG: 2-phospho-L-lactate guanylyltransferase [Anaerolineae bacterium]|nr:2-phospho-L-lactate guanylyltransferase [Anaerolineae bacterium]
MNTWAIVPVKPLNRAKSRLAAELLPEQRERLAIGLLMRTVRLLLPISQIQGVLVISRDMKALAMVRELGVQTVQESGAPELNNALYRATQVLNNWRVGAVLVVPADLPLLASEDIEAVVNLGRYQQTVVIAPDRHEHGTNLLLVRPPGLIPYSFGINSFAEHKRLAQETGATIHIYRSARVGLDVDTPDDLLRYHELAKVMGEPIIKHTGSNGWLLAEETELGTQPDTEIGL